MFNFIKEYKYQIILFMAVFIAIIFIFFFLPEKEGLLLDKIEEEKAGVLPDKQIENKFGATKNLIYQRGEKKPLNLTAKQSKIKDDIVLNKKKSFDLSTERSDKIRLLRKLMESKGVSWAELLSKYNQSDLIDMIKWLDSIE